MEEKENVLEMALLGGASLWRGVKVKDETGRLGEAPGLDDSPTSCQLHFVQATTAFSGNWPSLARQNTDILRAESTVAPLFYPNIRVPVANRLL